MNPVYFTGKDPVYMDDQELALYNRNFVNPQNPDPNQAESAIPAFNADMTPVSQEPKANSLESYGNPGGDPASGLYARGGIGLAGGTVALLGGNPMLGGAGLYLTAAEAVRQAVHGDSFTPDKYKNISKEERNNYLDNTRNAYNRASDLGPLSSSTPGGTEPPKGLVKYLEQVQPYEDMAFYNPGDKDLQGKYRAYGLSNWARQRIQDRWQGDMEGMESQALAKKYGLELPEHLKKKEPFSVDFSRGY